MHQARDFLSHFDPYDVAYITSKLLINQIANVRTVQRSAEMIFDGLADHHEYTKMKEEYPNYLDVVEKRLNKVNSGYEHRRYTILHAKRHSLGIADTDWSNVDKIHVGVKVIDLSMVISLCQTKSGPLGASRSL